MIYMIKINQKVKSICYFSLKNPRTNFIEIRPSFDRTQKEAKLQLFYCRGNSRFFFFTWNEQYNLCSAVDIANLPL